MGRKIVIYSFWWAAKGCQQTKVETDGLIKPPKNCFSELPFDSEERVNLMKEIRQTGGFKTAG